MSDKITQIVHSAVEKTIEALNEVSKVQSHSDEIPSLRTNENGTLASIQDVQKPSILTNKKQNIMATIIEKVTLDDVRKCLDNLGFNSTYYREEKVVVAWFSKDENFDYDVALMFKIDGDNNEWIKFQARAKGQTISQAAGGNEIMNMYLNANKYNSYRRYARAYVDRDSDDGAFFYVFEENIVGDQPITLEFLQENLRCFCSTAWHFYSTFTSNKNSQQ